MKVNGDIHCITTYENRAGIFLIYLNRFFLVLLLAIIFCEEGPDGLTSLTDLSDEVPGEKCAAGGYKVETGIDRNRDEVLDSSEIQQTEFICNGISGGRGDDGTTISELRLKIFGGMGAGSITPVLQKDDLIKFNINNYRQMDSVIFLVDGAISPDAGSKINNLSFTI